MNGFTTKTPNQKALDPTKRVKYSLGMVLGPDEFEQNLTYLMERDRLHNRSLHGYGTVCGLKVMQLMDDDDPTAFASPPQVMVQPGIAVSPQGQFIRVCQPQCGDLNNWLKNNKDQVSDYLSSPVEPDRLTLYVVLCFAECETDSTFVPGGPCRTQEETIVPSRTADSFELKLLFEAPAHVEEAVVDRFGDLLCRIEIPAGADTYTSQDELELLVRALSEGVVETDFFSPEEPPAPLYLHPEDAAGILEHIFRVWVTEVRPQLLACGQNCAGGPPDEECVLLAEIAFDVITAHDGRLLAGSPVSVNETDRPILLHTRLLQEHLLCGETSHHADHFTFATLSRYDVATIRAWIHHHELLDIPVDAVTVTGSEIEVLDVTRLGATNVFDIELASSPPLSLVAEQIIVAFDAAQIDLSDVAGYTLLESMDELDLHYIDRQDNILSAYLVLDNYTLNELLDVEALPTANGEVLTWDNGSDQWVAAPPAAAGVTDHGALDGRGDDDHPQYLLVHQGSRALIDDLNAANHKMVHLHDGEARGEALVYGQDAGGDLSDSYPDPTVAALQGQPLSSETPNDGEVLTWDDGGGVAGAAKWIAAQLPDDGGGPGVTDHGALDGRGDDDHPQYLLVNQGSRALINDLNAANHKVVHLSNGAAPGEALVFGQNAGGDLAGSYPGPRVQGLQGRPVVNAEPGDGAVLTWNRPIGRWEPKTGIRVSTFAEPDLTRIVALSWVHAGFNVIQLPYQEGRASALVTGLAIAFGKREPGDGGMALTATIDHNTFQVFTEYEATSGLMGLHRIVPQRIVPVIVSLGSNNLIVSAIRHGKSHTDGALFIFNTTVLDQLKEQARFLVVVKGDFILDENERAIDAEHVRAILPTGDRPRGGETGIQGGRFESWLDWSRNVERRVDINKAGVDELASLPGIGPATARDIVANRPYNSFDELTRVNRVSPGLVQNIRGLITIG